jgi:hypothetical protein
MDIANHPAWKLIPEYVLDTGSMGHSYGYFFLINASTGGMDYCIDKGAIEIFKGKWTTVHENLGTNEEALQVLATLIATDAIKP